MSFNEKLTLGILIGISTFFLTNIIIFLLKKKRINASILSEISYQISDLKEMSNFLQVLFQSTIIKDSKIEYSAYFTKEEFNIYNALQKDLSLYFGKRKLIKILKVYKAFWEINILMEGFFKDLTKWSDEKRILTNEDINWLKRKSDRIIKLISILTSKEIYKIEDLPDDYRGRIEPSTLLL